MVYKKQVVKENTGKFKYEGNTQTSDVEEIENETECNDDDGGELNNNGDNDDNDNGDNGDGHVEIDDGDNGDNDGDSDGGDGGGNRYRYRNFTNM